MLLMVSAGTMLHRYSASRSIQTKLKITLARSSSREVRIRVPFVLYSILVGEPSPKKLVQGLPAVCEDIPCFASPGTYSETLPKVGP